MENRKIVIHTFGFFDVLIEGQSLLTSTAESKKIWELYKFMLTHRNQSFTPEALIDQLWVSMEYQDPKGTLRRQMHRLRSILKESDKKNQEHTIQYINGYYQWNPKVSVWVDVDFFESEIAKGDSCVDSDPEQALHHYKCALDLYKGDFLSDYVEQHWVFTVRNHYKRLYLKTIWATIDIMERFERYEAMLELCQSAMKLDVYDEDFHVCYMEVLNRLGQHQQAILHYENVVKFFGTELGIKPTEDMKSLYKRLLMKTTINAIDVLDTNETHEEAYFCDPDVFKSIYTLERRRSERSGQPMTLCVLRCSRQRCKADHEQLKQHLFKCLRKGDIFTVWSDSEFCVLLPGVSSEGLQLVIDRVLNTFPEARHIEIVRNPFQMDSK